MLEGEVSEEGDLFIIKLKYGSQKITRDKVDHVEKTASADSEFETRWKDAAENVEKLVELGQWTQKNKLKEQHQQVLQKLQKLNPNHPGVQKLVYEYEKEDRKFEDDKGREAEILTHVGAGFKVLKSDHYMVFYNSNTEFARKRLGQFEKLYDEFYKYWEKKEFTLKTLPERMICLLFNSREDFQSYAQRTGGLAQAGGYWSSQTNWTYFFNTGKSADVLRVEESIEKQKKRIKEFEEQLKEPKYNHPDNKKILTEMKRDLKAFETDFEKRIVDENLSITIHEATHQLCYNLGVLNLNYAAPSWLVEGLAVYFETGTPSGAWLGPGRKNKEYISTIQKSYATNKIIPLEKFLTIMEGFFSGGVDTHTGYALSWCFIYFLMRSNQYEPKLRAYIKELLVADPYKKYSSKEVMTLIEKHFGPMDAFKKAWENSLKNLDAIPD